MPCYKTSRQPLRFTAKPLSIHLILFSQHDTQHACHTSSCTDTCLDLSYCFEFTFIIHREAVHRCGAQKRSVLKVVAWSRLFATINNKHGVRLLAQQAGLGRDVLGLGRRPAARDRIVEVRAHDPAAWGGDGWAEWGRGGGCLACTSNRQSCMRGAHSSSVRAAWDEQCSAACMR